MICLENKKKSPTRTDVYQSVIYNPYVSINRPVIYVSYVHFQPVIYNPMY